ncbi:hypothetical protein MMA231_04112 (plasmid) [Asticcacaulis sp. MM231]
MRTRRDRRHTRAWLGNGLALLAGLSILLLMLPLSPLYFTVVWLARSKEDKPSRSGGPPVES